MTSFYKRIFPVVWCGSLLVFISIVAKAAPGRHGPPLIAILIPACMLVLGYLLFRKLIADLMDEVWDNGNELIVVNGDHVERVPLANIINVSYSGLTNPKRVTLSLSHACRWGSAITFSPQMKFGFSWLLTHPMVEDLIRRTDQARRQG